MDKDLENTIPGDDERLNFFNMTDIDTATWTGYAQSWMLFLVKYAAEDPWGFVKTILLCLSPLFILSGLLSYKMLKIIEEQEKTQKRKAKRSENIAKSRGKTRSRKTD